MIKYAYKKNRQLSPFFLWVYLNLNTECNVFFFTIPFIIMIITTTYNYIEYSIKMESNKLEQISVVMECFVHGIDNFFNKKF